MDILGISAYYHDSAAALVRDGVVIAAAQEERFSRLKNDRAFPLEAIRFCLAEAGVAHHALDAVVFYDKPIDTFDRLVRSFVAAGPRGLRTWPTAMSEWMNRKLWLPYEIEKGLRDLGYEMPDELLFAEHHQSHAAAAFYPSPFDSACILTFDGVGEWATSSVGHGRGRQLDLLEEVRFPHSLGLLYTTFTVAAGFRANSGEYKLMGLAPYGRPVYRDLILEHLVELHDDGSFALDMRYFDFLGGRRMANRRFEQIFGPPRDPEAPITRRDCDLASSVQSVLEEAVLAAARHAHDLTSEAAVVLAGGVALNCVANSRLRRDGPFSEVWVQPAAGDAGSAVGCALWAWHSVLGHPRRPPESDSMSGSLLGPAYEAADVASVVAAEAWAHRRISDRDELAEVVARRLADGAIVGLFDGRMEFGPRALGSRSILADPRGEQTQRTLNLKIKHRESFRPFAPAVLAEHAGDWFEMDGESPYMTFVVPVRGVSIDADPSRPGSAGREPGAAERPVDLSAALTAVTSPLPAVTHVDGSARVQTVSADRPTMLRRILEAFDRRTDCPVLVNTSFNVRGEPIVCSPHDAYRTFMTTEIDLLVLEDCLLEKSEQPPWRGGDRVFDLD